MGLRDSQQDSILCKNLEICNSMRSYCKYIAIFRIMLECPILFCMMKILSRRGCFRFTHLELLIKCNMRLKFLSDTYLIAGGRGGAVHLT